MGSVLMGFSPDLERGVLNVGAAGWTTMFQRSLNWSLFKLFVDGAYRDKLDQQILLQTMQAHLDPVDGLSIAQHMLADPLDQIRIAGFPLGFWFGQQGSALVFVVLVFAYVGLMNALDKKYGVYEQ